MRAVIENAGTEPIPAVAWAAGKEIKGTTLIAPDMRITIDDESVTVVDLGHNPSLAEELRDAIASAAEGLRTAIEQLAAWLQQRPQAAVTEGPGAVVVSVENSGDAGIRALAGSNLDESEIAPGDIATISAPGPSPGAGAYVQLRQLGV